jgi:hypothetical protein
MKDELLKQFNILFSEESQMLLEIDSWSDEKKVCLASIVIMHIHHAQKYAVKQTIIEAAEEIQFASAPIRNELSH